ncbi:hypothetical protein HUW46_07681 [Amycolatopsis sp. CA-230715]|nr:hypothetical protein HUW46_07681 [Amycolatopsis sp. CA-230715]
MALDSPKVAFGDQRRSPPPVSRSTRDWFPTALWPRDRRPLPRLRAGMSVARGGQQAPVSLVAGGE